MKYRKGYKYQLASDELFHTSIIGYRVSKKRVELHPDGTVILREGYAWDGPSGPVFDRDTVMQASILHDALYEMMRWELVPHYEWRAADKEYGKQMKKDGAWAITVWINLMGLKLMNGYFALPKNRKKVYEVIS